VSWKQSFDFLPGIWGGFGLDTNYTYSPSDAGYKDVEGKTVPFQDNSVHQANVVLWYQRDGLQARLAYNYRSKARQDSERYLGRDDRYDGLSKAGGVYRCFREL